MPLLLLVAGGCVDRGKCLASETRTAPEYVEMIPIYGAGPGGTVTIISQIPNVVPAHDYDVCVRWEFPDGRPKEKKQ